MSSSTSSSESESARASKSLAAFTFVRVFLGTAAGLAGLVLIMLVLGDPFGTGRFTPLPATQIFETGPRVANATRVRDPAFNAAIIGNSTAQLLAPARLDALTGLRFVQLSIPGTGPAEQLAVAQAWLRERGRAARLLVIVADLAWCDARRLVTTLHPFPFPLYGTDTLAYVRHLFRMSAVEDLPRRLGSAQGRGRLARPDGYWDYEALGRGARDVDAVLRHPRVPSAREGRPASAAAGLSAFLAERPGQLRVVLLHPPIYRHPMDLPGPDEARHIAACKAELANALAAAGLSPPLDFWVDDDATRDPGLFLDAVHYTGRMAERMEAVLARTLAAP